MRPYEQRTVRTLPHEGLLFAEQKVHGPFVESRSPSEQLRFSEDDKLERLVKLLLHASGLKPLILGGYLRLVNVRRSRLDIRLPPS